MRLSIAGALAFALSSSVTAQSIPDLSTAIPIVGNWSYAPASDGSEAVFANATGYPQVWIRCSRSMRRVSIALPAAAAVPTVNVWTSSVTRGVASSFNPASGRATVDFANFDPLLDAVANSRGRIGFALGSQPALVVPAWPEVARVIEDCRA
jgi:hypothetical protein